MGKQSIKSSIESYKELVQANLSQNTNRTYNKALNLFMDFLETQGFDLDDMELSRVSENWLSMFETSIQGKALATQKVYLTVIIGWYKYLSEQEYKFINLKYLRQQVHDKINYQHIPSPVLNFEVARIIEYVTELSDSKARNANEKLRLQRDRALVFALADTGFSAEKLCELNRENVDIRRKRIQSKDSEGNNLSVRISLRLQEALSCYLEERAKMDIGTPQNIKSLPLFARHDKGAGNKIKRITPTTIRNIVSQLVVLALGAESKGLITPNSFHAFFVTSLIKESIELLHPKILNKCQDLFESGQFDDAIFSSMKVIEEEVRLLSSSKPTDIGLTLISKAMSSTPPAISFSSIEAEQKAAYFLFSGALGSFKNPLSHRFLDTSDPIKAYECLTLASLLLRMLDEAT